VAIKEKSKAVLEKSRKMVFNSEAELKADYETIHQARNDYDAALKEAEERGTALPPTEGVELRTTDELHAELETQEANLEMNLNTNPGVVEQYEKRKKEVCVPCKYLST
jgi:multidrug resistance efflux pump